MDRRTESLPTLPDASAQAALLACGPLLQAVVTPGLRLCWLSAGLADLCGGTPDRWLDSRLDELLQWRDADTTARALQALAAGQGFDGLAVVGRRHDGSELHCLVSARPVSGETPTARHALTLVDISEQMQQQARADALAYRLELVQEFGRIGLWERDIGTLEGRWDDQMYRFWGLDPDAGPPDMADIERRVLAEDGVIETYRDSFQRAGTYAARYRVTQSDGSVRHLQSQWRVVAGADGRPERAIGIALDDTEAYEAARSLAAANAQLALVVELGRIGVWRHELDSDSVHYDRRMLHIIGRPAAQEALALEQVRSWMHADDIPLLRATAQRTLATGEPTDAQLRFCHPDGHWVHVLTRRALERGPDGQPLAFLGVTLDISAQHAESQRALELSNRLAAAARAAGVGIWAVNGETGETDWNAQMFTLFDRVPGPPPALDEWIDGCVEPGDRERVRRALLGYLHAGSGLLEIEFRSLRRDGSRRWLVLRTDVERGRSDGRWFLGVVLDVTEQREALAALRWASERSALIARAVGIGTWELDLATGAAVWDAQMFTLRGLKPDDAAPPRAERLALLHPDDVERISNLLETDDSPRQTEFRVIWPDGSLHWLATRSMLIAESDGHPARRIGVNWDITEIKAVEAAQRDRLEALRENRAKSEFLARMSHELRTPLNAVLGFTQLLLHEGERGDAANRARRLKHVLSAGRHLLTLIDDVLDLSRVEVGGMSLVLGAVPLASLVIETLPLVEPLARELGIRVICGRIDGQPLADSTRLRQVLLNLLSNAIKYNRPGGSVLVEAIVEPAGHSSQVRLTVTDSGRGLSAEELDQVFEPFNRLGADRDGIEGTGIGLALVKALVELMGGNILAHSRPGEGSRFEVMLPQAGADDAPTAPALLLEPERSAGDIAATPGPCRGRLLYVEDNAVNTLIVEEMLRLRPDLSLHCVADGAAGVEQAMLRRPDLILLDMQLPDIDGHEVLRRLRADPRTAAIRCIAVSANAMPEEIERALRAGFADYWTKPLDLRVFLSALDSLFGTRPPGAGARS